MPLTPEFFAEAKRYQDEKAKRIGPIIISAPFGIYVSHECYLKDTFSQLLHWYFKKAYYTEIDKTPTLGTFTVNPGPNRFVRVLKTLRPRLGMQGWTNKLGLPNPGINSLFKNPEYYYQFYIISIKGDNDEDWRYLLERSRKHKPKAIELNVSCPNVHEYQLSEDVLKQAVETSKGTTSPIIVKCPPVNYRSLIESCHKCGVEWLHLCNTLPTPAGGLSGKPLKALSIDAITWVRKTFPDWEVKIIGGGGISNENDIKDYREAGADCFSLASYFLNPLNVLLRSKKDFKLFQKTIRVLNGEITSST